MRKTKKAVVPEPLNIISLGCGVQSTAMYYMSSMGILPRADYAIFADTGGERRATLKYLKVLQQWQKKNNGIPIIVVRKRNLHKDLLKGLNSKQAEYFASIPAFTKNADGTIGMLRRQCTGEYKIWQVDQAIRELYNLKPRQRNVPTIIWKGITLDEVERASLPAKNEKWKTFYYPFLKIFTRVGSHEWDHTSGIDKMYRSHVIEWFKRMGLPCPPKSSCFFCPYMSDKAWAEMKKNDPEEFKLAVRIDKRIRNSTAEGINSPIYLHHSCVPLDEIDFEKNQSEINWGECSGNCHL
jgi:hypothetical protein